MVIVGGDVNLGGVVIGAIVVVGMQQAFAYLPNIGTSDLGVALQTICASVLTVAFLAIRPKGILPERLHRVYPPGGEATDRRSDPGHVPAWRRTAAPKRALAEMSEVDTNAE